MIVVERRANETGHAGGQPLPDRQPTSRCSLPSAIDGPALRTGADSDPSLTIDPERRHDGGRRQRQRGGQEGSCQATRCSAPDKRGCCAPGRLQRLATPRGRLQAGSGYRAAALVARPQGQRGQVAAIQRVTPAPAAAATPLSVGRNRYSLTTRTRSGEVDSSVNSKQRPARAPPPPATGSARDRRPDRSSRTGDR